MVEVLYNGEGATDIAVTDDTCLNVVDIAGKAEIHVQHGGAVHVSVGNPYSFHPQDHVIVRIIDVYGFEHVLRVASKVRA